MSNINITLVKSTSGSIKKHKATIAALGLKKVGQTVTQPDNEAIRGMISIVNHLVRTSKG
ncbi:MAG: 50S ribosomal protein L30 [Eubacteriales bacterium]|jgi:large subunit ribosomal protein L30|nr:50S ribosomal protein L30 [Eubacteriales bacterium]MDD4326666.1 50S ribosomal protein L30 [Eubacteriales bacterium]MDD4716992.1 50S ribosomal protein L30 [Eubacteriales bacterium]NCU25687.1 50S ribosomal protein L30 [Candidatus Nomurabacteria bacterium]